MGARLRFLPAVVAATVFLLQLHALAPGEALSIGAAWTRTYNGAADGDEAGNGVATGPDGSVCVVGSTTVAGKGTDLLLRKYAPDGTLLWMKTYNGAANGDDAGYGVAVAPNGYIYVVGSTTVAGQGLDLLLQKYSPGGSRRWTRTYNGSGNAEDVGRGVAVGPDGSVAVTGSTETNDIEAHVDILVRKYSSRGSPLWTKTYDDDDDDRGHGVAFDDSGNVYVTGYVYAMGYSRNLALLKYLPGGAFDWVRTYDHGAEEPDVGYGVAVGPGDSVYVVGEATGLDYHSDLVLRKYSTSGAFAWAVTFDGGAASDHAGRGIAVGPDGSVYLTGSFAVEGEEGEGLNLLLQKYSSAGALSWTKTYNGAAGGDDGGLGVAVRGGAVYVTGTTETRRGDDNLLLRKYR